MPFKSDYQKKYEQFDYEYFFYVKYGREWIKASPTRMVEQKKSMSIISHYNTVLNDGRNKILMGWA